MVEPVLRDSTMVATYVLVYQAMQVTTVRLISTSASQIHAKMVLPVLICLKDLNASAHLVMKEITVN